MKTYKEFRPSIVLYYGIIIIVNIIQLPIDCDCFIFFNRSVIDDFTEFSCNITTIPPSEENILMISEIVTVGLENGELATFTVNSNSSITFGSECHRSSRLN